MTSFQHNKRERKSRDKLYQEYLKDRYDRASKKNTFTKRNQQVTTRNIEKVIEDNDYGQDYF